MKVPSIKDSYRGQVPINWFPAADDDTEIMMFGTPGLVEFCSLTGATTVWAGTVMDDYLYVTAQTDINTCTVYSIDKSGNTNIIGTIVARSGPIGMVNNGTQVLITHKSNGYVYDILPKAWTANTAYLENIYVRPSTLNGFYYKCSGAGASGATEPTWPTTLGGTVDEAMPEIWVIATTYEVSDRVRPTTASGFYYKCTVPGTSSGTTEPTWPTTLGSTVTDNGITWTAVNDDVGVIWTVYAEAPIFAQITDPNFIGGLTCAFQDGYGIVVQPDSRYWQVSSLYDFTTYDSDGQAAKEGGSDNIKAVIADHLNIWIFGERTTEIWYNSGSSPFPFLRLAGTFIEKGIAATASLAKGDNCLFWLTNEGQMVRSVGYQAKIISTRKFDREIANYDRIDDAIGYFYVMEGHSFYDLHFPDANVTWSYDAATELLHKKSSFPGTSRHRGNCYFLFENMQLVGDHINGKIYRLDMNCYTDDGNAIKAILESNQFYNEGKLIFFPDMQLVFEHGKEVPADSYYNQDNAPQAMLSWSSDGARTFPTEIWEPIGNVGEYEKRTIFRQLGASYKRTYRLTVSSPINRNILSVGFLK